MPQSKNRRKNNGKGGSMKNRRQQKLLESRRPKQPASLEELFGY